MIVNVTDKSGEVLFSYDTQKLVMCVCPAVKDRERTLEALYEAATFILLWEPRGMN